MKMTWRQELERPSKTGLGGFDHGSCSFCKKRSHLNCDDALQFFILYPDEFGSSLCCGLTFCNNSSNNLALTGDLKRGTAHVFWFTNEAQNSHLNAKFI